MRFERIWTGAASPVDRLVPPLLPLIRDASNPFADWYFGGPHAAMEIIEEWMMRPSSEYFVGRSLLLFEEQWRPVGCVIALGGAELGRCRSSDFAAFCDELEPGPEAHDIIEQVVASSRALFPPVAEDELYISRVAIDATRRGRGLGKALVAKVIELKRAEGFRSFRLDVNAHNPGAIRTYEAIGMRIGLRSLDRASGLEYCTMTLTA